MTTRTLTTRPARHGLLPELADAFRTLDDALGRYVRPWAWLNQVALTPWGGSYNRLPAELARIRHAAIVSRETTTEGGTTS